MFMRIFENKDNSEGMSKYPDGYFNLAIVDPPYGIKIGSKVGGGKILW
jgi:site-specific DNA-methyltransferase (adenine-specific)